MGKIKPLSLRDVVIDDRFWGRYIKLVREKVIPYQWEMLNDRIADAVRSHCIKNFEIAAGQREGEYYGMVFQDSDLYKWLESVSFSLETQPDPALERLADEAIELIGAAQQSDGYVNTYYTIHEQHGRWTNLQQGHELYCAGHMIEAAVAHWNATGKRNFLDIAMRFADCIDNTFGPEEHKLQGYPGHQEIELALYKLYEATGERRYLQLADYFIRQRGMGSNYFDHEQQSPAYRELTPQLTALDRSYSQSHIPPVEQREACGHAVRAVYMYSAMADLAAESGDKELQDACDALYYSITESQMYITGAIGSTSIGESFTAPCDLPNDLVYGETCASIGLMMFCRRMNVLHGDARFIDTMEQVLYNTVIAGISLTGTEFFYVNPLEVNPLQTSNNPCYQHVKPVRQKWFDCSCCPTNIARTVMGLGGYLYGTSADGLYVNLYCSSTAGDCGRSIAVKTDYPYGNKAAITATGGRYKLYLRSPLSAPVLSLKLDGQEQPFTVENGYVVLECDWQGEEIQLLFDVHPRRVYSRLEVQNNIGRTAVMRGPLVYCMEQVDNGEKLGAFLLPKDSAFCECRMPEGLPQEAVALEVPGYQYIGSQNDLYSSEPPTLQKTTLRLIPYYLWANRGENEMRVYIPTESLLPESR